MLLGNAVQHREDRAQWLVPGHQVVHRCAQCRRVQVAGHPERERHVVGRRRAFQAVLEPDALLRVRQRQRRRPHRLLQRRPGSRPAGQALGQVGDARCLEQGPDGELHAQRGADPADQPGGEQRVAAQVEEAVVDGDPVDAQHLREQVAQQRFAVVARAAPRAVAGVCGCGQCLAVDLAVGGHRDGVDQHQHRGHQVLRQPLGEPGAQRLDQSARCHRPGRCVDQRVRVGFGLPQSVERGGGQFGRQHHRVEQVGAVPAVGGGHRPAVGVAPGVQRLGVERLPGVGLREVREPGPGRSVLQCPQGVPLRRGPLVEQAADPDAAGVRRDDLLDGCQAAARPPRLGQPRQRVRGHGRLVQRHVVAVQGHLVAAQAPLQPDVDPGDVRAPGQCREEPGIDDEFPLQAQRRVGRLQYPCRLGVRSEAPGLERDVEGAQRHPVAHVADEDPPAGPQQRQRALQHPRQVIAGREVLDHGVDHDGVEVSGGQALEVVRAAGGQVGAPGPLGVAQLKGEPVDHRGGEVGGPVGLHVRQQFAEQQAGADADLQHVARLQCEDPADGGGLPFAHLGQRDRCAGVGAVPAGEVRAEPDGVLVPVQRLVRRLPVGHEVARVGVRVRHRHHVADQAAVAGDVLAHHHGGGQHRRVLPQHRLDLAGLDPVAAQLHLVVGAADELQLPPRGPADHVPGPVHP